MNCDILDRMIADHMRNAWLQWPPTVCCFDHDQFRMQMLMDFLLGEATVMQHEAVKAHLLACERCRFIYASLSAEEPQP